MTLEEQVSVAKKLMIERCLHAANLRDDGFFRETIVIAQAFFGVSDKEISAEVHRHAATIARWKSEKSSRTNSPKLFEAGLILEFFLKKLGIEPRKDLMERANGRYSEMTLFSIRKNGFLP